jgi:alanine-synthesizing transaminase
VVADTYLSVNTPAQWALPELLASGAIVREQIRARVASNRRWLETEAQGAAWQVYPADGGWSAVLRVPRLRNEEEWCVLLAEAEGVLLHPGYFFEFDTEGILVASLLPPEERFRSAMERARRRFEAVD